MINHYPFLFRIDETPQTDGEVLRQREAQGRVCRFIATFVFVVPLLVLFCLLQYTGIGEAVKLGLCLYALWHIANRI